MQRSDGNWGGVGNDNTNLSVDRRSYLKLAGVAAGSVPILSGTASAAFTRRGIQFERSVDMVADAGCDPTGQEPCDAQIQDAADSFTLLRFPPGEYKVTEKNVILNETNVGFLGEGDVRFVVPERFNEKLLVVDSGTGVLFENIDIDQRADGATPALHLGGDDDVQVHDVELIGQGIHPDSLSRSDPGWSPGEGASNGNPDVMDFFYPIVRSPDGTGLVTNLEANNHGLMGAYNAGDGRSGIWVGIETRGTVTFRDCHIEEFGSNGTYTSRTNGVVQFEGGVYRNNDNNQIRIGSSGSYIDGAVLDVDADASDAPNPYEALNYRGVRVEMGRQSDRTDIDIRDCDIAIRSAPHSGGGVVAEATASEFSVHNTRIGIDVDGVRGVLGKEPDGGGAYDPPAKPHAATLENMNITGTAGENAGATLFNRPDSVADGCCIHQEGSSRDGVRLVKSDGSQVTNSTIDVTGRQVVEDGSSVWTNNIDASGSCPVPDYSGDDGLPQELSIESNGGRFSYRFAVSGDLEKSTARGATIDDSDTISGSTATGQGGGNGVDSYSFSGEIVAFDLDGDAAVYLDSAEVNPARFPEHTISIVSNGGRFSYTLSVTDGLEKSTARGATIDDNDSISGNTATGQGGGSGVDSYSFSGTITDLDVDGDADVYLDGKSINTSHEHTLTIVADGSYSSYDFSVTGDISPRQGIGGGDSISGSSASGALSGDGTDVYGFSGIVMDIEVDGNASVLIDSDRVEMGHEHTLTVEADGPYSSYGFSVSGDINPRYGLGGVDSISRSSASGALSGSGIDSYGFSGAITSLNVDGNANVYLDGERVETSHEHTLTIEADGSYSSYEFTASGDVSPRQGIGGSDSISGSSASGALSGSGQDVYGFSGELRTLAVDGSARVTVDGGAVETGRDVVTITSNGGRFSYRLSASESLEKSTAMGASIDDNDSVSGSTATGQGGGGGLDSYEVVGKITKLYLDGDVQLYRNGIEVGIQEFLPKTLTVEATGPYARYGFSASGGIAARERIGGVDSVDVDAGRATGAISGDGRDSYAFAGELRDLNAPAEVNVYANGKQIA